MSSPTDEKQSTPAAEKTCDQQCWKCGTECVGDGKCKQNNCKCDTSCKCKSNHEQPGNTSKPADCKSSNPGDCSDGSCKLTKPSDPATEGNCPDGKCMAPNVSLEAEGKGLAAALFEGPEKPESKVGENKECEGRVCGITSSKDKKCEGKQECDGKSPEDKEKCEAKAAEDKKRCPQSGNCDGSIGDTSLLVFHPNRGSPGGSPRSQTAEQKGETDRPKGELKACAHPEEDNVHKQETHDKLCSPLPQGDKLKAILFDIDGTIADSDPIHFLAFQEILAEEGYNGGVPISHEFFIRQMSGKLNYAIAEELMPEMEEKKRIQMMDEKEARYRKLAAKDLQPIPGFLEFSEYVKKRGLRRAAVTNSPRLNAEQVISALKIPDFFEIVVVGSECDNPKPYPDPYLKAIKFLGVEPNQCFVLEDSPSGIKAGRAAGSPVVGLLTGHPGPVLRDNGASVLIQNYHDSALWTALGEEACAGNSCSKSHDSTPSTGVPPPIPVLT